VKILALAEELPGVAPAQDAPLLKAEPQSLWELHLQGGVREIFFRADRTSAVPVQKLIRFTLIPLAPYPGFARLFSPPEAPPRPD
jgi:hypothetical protein